MRFLFSVFAASLLFGGALHAQVDFQRDVRPIISDACFHCHGPDEATRMAGLRLDTREGAFAARKNGAAVVPRNLQASLLYQRIFHEKPALRMPPAHANKTLTDAQKNILKQWIEQGASWSEHWSFVAPVRPELPAVKDSKWVRNPIDNFILARLEAAGLKPMPQADRRTLIRRVSLDLTGLPPEPHEVEAFVNDKSKDAYEKLVDRLLESPHYGEHRSRYWLDAARYADTHGVHIDNYREMWPYRDWVIKAFNRNLPFDQFTIEQVAGDLLPDRTLEQQIASGFHRCNVTTNEAGVILEEVEAIYAKDRVDTTSAVWLGLTVGCATCHDHKFDPILQKDFYSLAAFFRNTTQPVMDGNISDTPPIVVVPRPDDRPRWSELIEQESAAGKRLKELRSAPGADFDKWIAEERFRAVQAPVDQGFELAWLSLDGEPQLVTKRSPAPLNLTEGLTIGEAFSPGHKALHFGKEASVEIPGLDSFGGDTPFSVAAWVYVPKDDGNFTVVSKTDEDDKGRGWAFEINARVPVFRLTGDKGKGIQVRAGHLEQLKPGSWNHLAFSYDGTREHEGMALHINGEAVQTQGGGEPAMGLQGDIRTEAPVRIGSNGKRYFAGGAIADLRIYNRVISEDEASLISRWPVINFAREKAPGELTAEEREALRLYFLQREHSGYQELLAQLDDFRSERREIRRRGAVTHVMQEIPDSEPMTHILNRGQYDQPREAVEPAVPSALPPMPASFPRNRLGLAKWLVDESNPLTARVTVNRFWQQVFGTGIVKTSGDFGSQGDAPSHPKLLDWLAIEFRESGWDMKEFFRLIVTSAAYRQATLITEDNLQKDPDNRLLSRGPRFRMDGEMVRDYALAASGLLVPKIGGPSVKPYQPKGVWEAVAMENSNTRFYKPDTGDKLYRRSLYTFWKRSAPPASMDIFNAPTRETCTVSRERTNTPLQALVTMNDPQFVEASRHLAGQAIRSAEDDFDRQLNFLTWHLLSRTFDEQEREVAKSAYKDYMIYYDSNPKDAKKLISTGDSQMDSSLPVSEFAALTMMASQIMNLDEVLNK